MTGGLDDSEERRRIAKGETVRLPGEQPAVFARRAAAEKAADVAGKIHTQENRSPWIVGADTVVVLDGDILLKPKDDADAVDMLGVHYAPGK